MSKKTFVLTSLLTALCMSIAISGSTVSSAAPDPSTAAPPVAEQGLNCGAMICHSNEDCGFPDLCGGCIRPSGSFFGHCAPTP